MNQIDVDDVFFAAREYGMILSMKQAEQWVADIMSNLRPGEDAEDFLWLSMKEEARYWEMDSREAEEFEQDRY